MATGRSCRSRNQSDDSGWLLIDNIGCKHLVKPLRLVSFMLFAAAPVYAQSFSIPQELWDRPRSAAAVMERPAIGQAVSAWLALPGGRLVVHHGAGQEALLQAEELRAWLIALAIEAERVLLRNDLAPTEPLRLEILRN